MEKQLKQKLADVAEQRVNEATPKKPVVYAHGTTTSPKVFDQVIKQPPVGGGLFGPVKP